MRIVASGVIVDPIAVANVTASLAAISPDRELDEPRKRLGERRIERSRVNLAGKPCD